MYLRPSLAEAQLNLREISREKGDRVSSVELAERGLEATMGRHLQSGKQGVGVGMGGSQRLQHLCSGGLGASREKRAGTPCCHRVDLDSVLCPRMDLLVCSMISRACGVFPSVRVRRGAGV